MAEEQDSSQERSEEATPKRRSDAREKGDIARSKELNTAAILIGGAVGMILFGGVIVAGLARTMRYNLVLDRRDIFEVDFMAIHLSASMVESLVSLLPVFTVLILAAILGPLALGGWVLSAKALAPQWSRLSLLKGLKRMFAVRALMELLKSIAKVVLVVALAILILLALSPEIISIGKQDTVAAMVTSLDVVGWAVLGLSCTMLIIAAIDIPFQLYDHTRKLKMTRQEVKDEMKNTEGKPEVRSRIRQLQYDMSQRRMMSAVPEADVVITNPEHFAVALRYNSNQMGAPVLVAKGADLVAQKIREIALAHKVPILASPPLARAVFYSTEIDQQIPAGLYVAVAQVLAYVFQLKRFKQGKGQRPGKLPEMEIPENLRRDK